MVGRGVAPLSSVWLGVTLLTLIFVYSAIGSALPAVRQHRWIELTESGWFETWPFMVLIGLLCANLTVVTLRCIPFNRSTVGVWVVHGGVVVLCGGSAAYFHGKIDGDMLVYRRRARIVVPGAPAAAELVIRPQNRVVVAASDGPYAFQVHHIDPALAPDNPYDRPPGAYHVAIMVTTPQHRFIRHLLEDTEVSSWDEAVSGGQRSTGPIEPAIRMTLDYVAQDAFSIQHTSALFVRATGTSAWHQRPLQGMPLYNDRLSSAGDVWATAGEVPPLDPLDAAAPPAEHDPLRDVRIRAVGYLREAVEEERWLEGGPHPHPVIELDMGLPGPVAQPVTLELAGDVARAQRGDVAGVWVESLAELHAELRRAAGGVIIEDPAGGTRLDLPVVPPSGTAEASAGVLPGTGVSCRIVDTVDRLTLDGATHVAVARVECRTPRGTFVRSVADDPLYTDAPPEGAAALTMRYEPGRGPALTAIMGPPDVPLTWVVRDAAGCRQLVAGAGQRIERSGAPPVTVLNVYRRAQRVVRPVVVPRDRRDPNLGRGRALACVVLSSGAWEQRLWVPYSEYVLPSAQYAVPHRVRFQPRRVELPDGRGIDIVFSRRRCRLGGAVALDDFDVVMQPGGTVTGTGLIREMGSHVRFRPAADADWGDVVEVAPNRPARFGPWWLFQAAWDPPAEDGGGMTFSGMGVARRRGVYVQLLGAVMVAAGAAYSFYVRPLLRRRSAAVH